MYDNYFTKNKIQWLPLYLRLKEKLKTEGIAFEEHFPKMGIVWRHTSAFAIIYPKVKCLEISFCCDGISATIPSVRYMRVSKHRVTHYVRMVDESILNELYTWLVESYNLTQKKL